MEQPRTRQELYERIRADGGKDAFVLEEMIRLGFWRQPTGLPDDPSDELHRAIDLQRELNSLRAENRGLNNEQALIKAARKQRLAESKQKQKETKERRRRESEMCAAAWQKRKATEILYLGEDVSAGLSQFESNVERLNQLNLPIFSRPEELAGAMNISVGKLRFLAFSRAVTETTHYINFKIPKKSGGFRQISAPMPLLKGAQTWILENILNAVPVHENAHGFLPGKNIVSNAQAHVGAQMIINFDLENFFPSITYKRVKGVFRALGYSEAVATVLGLVCTAPDTEEIELDGKSYFVALSERHLPQGSPASPAISNLVARRLDKSLAKIAADNDFVYTRYADDLTFSTAEKESDAGQLMRQIRYVVAQQDFIVNETKTRILRRGRQQEVTGIIVNDKISIDRKTLRKFRATLHQAETKGLDGLHWGNSPDLIAALRGYANFVFMVDKEKGYAFQQQVRRIAEKYDWQPAPPRFTAKIKEHPSETAETVQPEDKPWWKLW